ncbi:MAG: hypothetical protein LBS93_01010 [Synergistaceae bacterium]|jgi:hypothetical protein|nr:hypothetical protein [Synergistaceae bacterium]
MKSTNVEIRSDMLNIHSTVQEILRALYFYSSDYIMVTIGKNERLLHKDQLIALLEQGRAMATLEDMLSVALAEPLVSRMNMEDIPPSEALLVFSGSELSGDTFEGFRERRLRESRISLPEWWGVPLPLLHIKEDRVSLNDSALGLIPSGVKALARQIEKIKNEKIIVIKEKKKERTFTLSPLSEETFIIEDVSGDYEMVDDLVWRAAVGSAFVRRMEEQGLMVRRLSPHAEPPSGAVEIIPCSWEGEIVGNLAIIELPEGQEELAGGEARSAPESSGKGAAKKSKAPVDAVRSEPVGPARPAAPQAPRSREIPKIAGSGKIYAPEALRAREETEKAAQSVKAEKTVKAEKKENGGKSLKRVTARTAKPHEKSADVPLTIEEIPEDVIGKYAEQVEIFQAAQLLEPAPPAKPKPRSRRKSGQA